MSLLGRELRAERTSPEPFDMIGRSALNRIVDINGQEVKLGDLIEPEFPLMTRISDGPQSRVCPLYLVEVEKLRTLKITQGRVDEDVLCHDAALSVHPRNCIQHTDVPLGIPKRSLYEIAASDTQYS